MLFSKVKNKQQQKKITAYKFINLPRIPRLRSCFIPLFPEEKKIYRTFYLIF